MARFVAGAVFGLVVGVMGAAAAGLHAEDLDGVHADTLAAANEAHVDLVDLLGAMSTTGLPARGYLYTTGELVPPAPPLVGAIARADCIIAKESGGLDIPNRQGSGAQGPGQYFVGTWGRHTTLYRAATGYGGPLSLHSLQDVRRVMSWILAAMPSTRREWSVGGCA